MPEFVVPKRKEQADTESQFSHTLSGLFNFFNTEASRQSRKVNLDKEKSKSGWGLFDLVYLYWDVSKTCLRFHVGASSSAKNHGNLARANSCESICLIARPSLFLGLNLYRTYVLVAFYHNTKPSPGRDEPVNYVNISRHSISKPTLDRERGGSERERCEKNLHFSQLY